MWLHRENEYEWKYIGVWLDSLPKEFYNKIKSQIPDYELESIFVPFKQYANPMDMIQDSLKIRNSIPAILDVNSKTQNEIHNAKISALEIKNAESVKLILQSTKKLLIYMNSKDRFYPIRT